MYKAVISSNLLLFKMLVFSVLFLLLSNALTLRRDKSILFSRVAIFILFYSSVLAIISLYIVFFDRGIGLYGGLFHVTSITHVFQMFIFFISALILQLTAFYPRRVLIKEYSSLTRMFFYKFLYYRTKIINKMAEQFKIIEYPLIILFINIGAAFLVSTSDFVSVFLAIELQSYGLYLLSTLYRDSELATSGGLTYFLLGGLSSCFILLGVSILYANSGTTNLEGIYVITSLSDLANGNENALNWYRSDYLNFSLLILSVGFLFKVSAAPFHFWSPDVYDGIPTIVTTFVAIVAKISIFIFLLELVHYTSNNLFNFQFTWTSSLLWSSLFSLLIGTIVGLTEVRLKRLFAYSTISHVGFILLALAINSVESTQAFIFYLMQYSISNLNAFFIVISMGFTLYYYFHIRYDKSGDEYDQYEGMVDKNNSPIQLVNQLKGFFYINPILALSFGVTIFSFAGIPPLIGFFAKQMVLSAALDSGYIFISLIAILTSVISAVYYLNTIKEVFFDRPNYCENVYVFYNKLHGNIVDHKTSIRVNFRVKNIILSSYLTITISVLTLIISLFILISPSILKGTGILVLILFNH